MNFFPLLPLMQPFLKWRYPVRIHQHTKAVTPPPDLWKFIKEGFYDDYTDTHNSKPPHSTMLSNMHITVLWLLLAGDAKNEVPITNLAKIEFPGREPKKAVCKLIFTRSLWKLCILIFNASIDSTTHRWDLGDKGSSQPQISAQRKYQRYDEITDHATISYNPWGTFKSRYIIEFFMLKFVL